MKYTTLLFLLLFSFLVKAKIINPIKWSTEIKLKDKNTYTLNITAKLEDGWHIYSQNTPKGGPLATTFNIQEHNAYDILGNVSEPTPIEKYDESFGMNTRYFEDQVTFIQNIKLLKSIDQINVDVTYILCGNNACLPPKTKTLHFNMKSYTPSEQNNYWGIFWVAFLSGFLALLTPCVFPMIPLTISFFSKDDDRSWKNFKKELLYGGSIIFIYTVLGYLVTVLFGADTLNRFSTSIGFNFFFFIILIIFALSFFGAFNIELPASWANALDKRSRKGGLLGIFFMALVLVVVSFSCTGPIIGTLLVKAATQGGLYPIFGMLGFSTALALPFMFFAAFPAFLKALPKSGSWMETVKISLGFIELALAVKFLSNIDLVLQLHWLDRQLFIAIWMSIFIVFALFLLGVVRLQDGERFQKATPIRILLGIIIFTFSLYLSTGLFAKAPLNFLSGILPPEHYGISPPPNIPSISPVKLPKGRVAGPYGIPLFKNYDEALQQAKTENKPVLVHFTGHACSNCRQMESGVWGASNVLKILKDEVILVSLFVDDKRELDKQDQYLSKLTQETVKTIGKKWSEFEAEKYNTNTQPFYVMEDVEGNNLQEPIAYTLNNNKFENWLNNGIDAFNNKTIDKQPKVYPMFRNQSKKK